MRIVGWELVEVRLPLAEPFTSGVGVRTERRILLLRVRGDEGFEGWGECVAGETPAYSYETTETAWLLLTEWLLPGVVGRELLGPEEILAPAAWIRGHRMAKATLEMAIWDLQAREDQVPLWELLGGSGEGVPVGVVVGEKHSAAETVDAISTVLDRGYASVKLKVGPKNDLERLRAVRSRFPDLRLGVDANGGYVGVDPARVAELDAFDLAFIEQPLPPGDWLGHARLQERLRTPICLDESIGSREELELALELGACRIVSLKPGQVGGLGEARALHDLCRSRGVPVRVGGMLESGIGRGHNLALASLPGFTLAGDLSESRRYWERDLVTPEFAIEEGRMRPGPGAGIGVLPDSDRIGALATRRVWEGWVE